MGGMCTKVGVIDCSRPLCGEMRIAYKYKTGEYCSRGGSQDFREARTIVPGLKTIGVYYDDPKEHDSKYNRYLVGVILSDTDRKPHSDITSIEKKFAEKGYSFMTLPQAQTAVQTSFPLSNPTSRIAYAIASCKVYDKFQEYIKAHSLRWNPAVEIYSDNCIHFMIPQTDGDKFLVPEMKEGKQIVDCNAGTFRDKEWKEWHQ